MSLILKPGPRARELEKTREKRRECDAELRAINATRNQTDDAVPRVEARRAQLIADDERLAEREKYLIACVAPEEEAQLVEGVRKYEEMVQPALDRIHAAKQRAIDHDEAGKEIVREWRAAEAAFDFLSQQINTVTTQLTKYRESHATDFKAANVASGATRLSPPEVSHV